jgi:hypothetical protein
VCRPFFATIKPEIGTTSETVQAFLAKAAALGGAALDDYLRGLGRFVERARYGVENEGHFALSLPAYMHFTSPIRRFPDLVNARQLHAILTGKPVPYTRAELEDIAEHTTAVQHAIKDKGRANFRKKEKDQQGIISDLSFSDPTVAVTTIAQIQNEIRASSVSLVNLARTLFIPPRQDGDWANVRRAALVFLENNPEHIPSVLSIATAKLGITFATQDLGQRGLPHQPIFEYCATITGQDHDAVGSTVGYVTKRESERRAALGAIYAWPRSARGKNGYPINSTTPATTNACG